MTPRVQQYAREAAEWHGVEVGDILGRSRKLLHCEARAAVMRWLRRDGFSTVQIGAWLNRDHSTVVYWTKHKRPTRRCDRAPTYFAKPVVEAVGPLARLNTCGA
ncbi:MAG: hypothetical protein EON59_00690 [Alphaproteobacteria bacterium]|nr:MAG: hypothetical protein EON59_00690 [Alphaproteobacteria bacterium]